jgi:lipopolysaccharide export LptBFGC system permease protein LptF
MLKLLLALLSLPVLYLLSFPVGVIIAAVIVRNKLRKYQEMGPF